VADTSGESIPAVPQHWQDEPFLPVPCDQLLDFLGRQPAVQAADGAAFRKAARRLSHCLHTHYRRRHQLANSRYAALDPDRDIRMVTDPDPAARQLHSTEVAELMVESLRGANYTRLTREQIDDALTAVSDWGVRLRVDFDVFEHLEVWARGDILAIRERRRWHRLWRPEPVEVPIFQRLVVMFQLRPGSSVEEQLDSTCLHLRIFKNIPKADVDMLLPSTRVRLSWVDRWKILVPTVSGITFNLYKIIRGVLILAFVGIYGTLALVALVAAATGYAVRSFLHFGRARDRYLLSLARSLYFQKLDSNAGVITRILEEAEQQDLREAILAYAALHAAGQPLSVEQIKERGVGWIVEAIQLIVDFEADDALRRLEHFGFATVAATGNWQTVQPAPAGTIEHS
jgi:hypothetical protein